MSESPDLVVDATGLRCPAPVIELARRIGDVPLGGLVELRSDDAGARVDVPAWCRMRGQDYVGERAVGERAVGYLVRRTR